MLRNGKKLEAIQYARKNFSNWTDTHMSDIRKVMALLAFGPKAICSRYKVPDHFLISPLRLFHITPSTAATRGS
jgi:hypothetical protein